MQIEYGNAHHMTGISGSVFTEIANIPDHAEEEVTLAQRNQAAGSESAGQLVAPTCGSSCRRQEIPESGRLPLRPDQRGQLGLIRPREVRRNQGHKFISYVVW